MTLNQQFDPAIDRDGAGNFVVSWTTTQDGTMDIYARAFTASGTPLTNEILVPSAFTEGEEKDSAVWKEYLANVMKKRGSSWRDLYRACSELNA